MNYEDVDVDDMGDDMGDDNLCFAVRDYPPDCIPLPSVNSDTKAQTKRASVPWTPPSPPENLYNFKTDQNYTPEELYFMRRRRYDALLRYYQGRQDSKAGKGRPDLTAMQMMKLDKQVSTGQGIGNVPGAAVGDIFYYRTELMVLGLHNQMQAGIGGVTIGEERLACSIVASGGYEDDEDHGETLVYTGEGGNDRVRRVQTADQLPEKGNLALMKISAKKEPVRVIRGHENISSDQSPAKTIYSYDGLYNVMSYRREVGNAGFHVYKFKLERCPGQPKLRPIGI